MTARGSITNRCGWSTSNPLMVAYHDREWGVPLHDERTLFELLALEAMQAGLSWSVVLQKRDNFRGAFHAFDPGRVARYTERDIRRLLADAGIIRNRAKIEAAVEFMRMGGPLAIITDPPNLARAMRGETGTRILPG